MIEPWDGTIIVRPFTCSDPGLLPDYQKKEKKVHLNILRSKMLILDTYLGKGPIDSCLIITIKTVLSSHLKF